MFVVFKRALGSFQFRSLFIRLISYFLLLVVILAILLSMVWRSWFGQSLQEKEIDITSFDRLNSVKSFQDALLRDIDQMIVQLANMEAVQKSLDNKDASLLYPAVIQFGSDFRQRFKSSYCIQSVTIYINEGGIVQVPIVGSPSNTVIASSEMNALANIKKEDRWTLLPQNTGLSANGNSHSAGGYLVLSRAIPLVGSTVKGTVVVVFDPVALFQSPFVQESGEKIWVVPPGQDKAFETLGGSRVPEDDFKAVSRLLASGKLAFNTQIERVPYAVRISDSTLFNWNYVYAVPYDDGASWAKYLLYGVLLAALAAVGWQVTAKARQIQRYIATITAMLDKKRKKQEFVSGSAGSNEFSYVISEIHSLMEQRLLLQNRMEQTESAIKETNRQKVLLEALSEPAVDLDERLQRFAELDLEPTEFGYFVAVVRTDNYLEFTRKYSLGDQNLLRYFISKVSEELLSADYQVYGVRNNARDFTLFCNLRTKTAISVARDAAFQAVNTVTQHIHSYLNLTVSVGIGDILTDLGCISESYKQALQSLEFSFLKGAGSIIPTWHVRHNHHLAMFLYNERKSVEQEIAAAIQEGAAARAVFELNRMENILRGLDNCPPSLIQQTFLEIAMTMLHHHPGFTHEAEQQQLKDIHEHLGNPGTLAEMIEWMRQLAGRLCVPPDHDEAAKESVIAHILSYIQANHDKDISLNGIADQLQMDPSYLSRLFKQETGMNFIDYLLSLRIKHAKVLLLTTNGSVGEISQQVGYFNAASFIRIFKKFEGVTPGQYRAANTDKSLDIHEIY
ncbi:response regulator transcription factor [Paenibacillus thalictri]|uniref:AraC family transcriptional regulator n=1 Tax=Paenibacillus thalictri TaxID=2527873 RepID=A0A4Q9DMV8_9BACL|nr:response regulator transcription factor [Paenibacillus thalictri]TBL77250.1 AraC family transcriptional regulator [Paenibacillus thalictri]